MKFKKIIMKRWIIGCVLLLAVARISAQVPDSVKTAVTATVPAENSEVKAVNQEIGFNVISLLTQLTIFTSTNVTQLPFDVFYNIYVKDRVGLRFGTGFIST